MSDIILPYPSPSYVANGEDATATVFNRPTGQIQSNVEKLKEEIEELDYEPSFEKNTAFNKNFGTAADTVCEGDDGRLSDPRTPTAHTHDASNINSGILDLDRIPHGALERLVVVANQAARFALTIEQVQDGDTVKQEDTGIMYFVVDDTNLDSESGYTEYTAATATAVAWTGVTSKPTYIDGHREAFSSSLTWTVNHNFGVQFVQVSCYDSNNDLIMPNEIKCNNANTCTITWISNQAGNVIVSV